MSRQFLRARSLGAGGAGQPVGLAGGAGAAGRPDPLSPGLARRAGRKGHWRDHPPPPAQSSSPSPSTGHSGGATWTGSETAQRGQGKRGPDGSRTCQGPSTEAGPSRHRNPSPEHPLPVLLIPAPWGLPSPGTLPTSPPSTVQKEGIKGKQVRVSQGVLPCPQGRQGAGVEPWSVCLQQCGDPHPTSDPLWVLAAGFSPACLGGGCRGTRTLVGWGRRRACAVGVGRGGWVGSAGGSGGWQLPSSTKSLMLELRVSSLSTRILLGRTAREVSGAGGATSMATSSGTFPYAGRPARPSGSRGQGGRQDSAVPPLPRLRQAGEQAGVEPRGAGVGRGVLSTSGTGRASGPAVCLPRPAWTEDDHFTQPPPTCLFSI